MTFHVNIRTTQTKSQATAKLTALIKNDKLLKILHFTRPQTDFLYRTQPDMRRRHSFLETLVIQYTDFTVKASLYGIPVFTTSQSTVYTCPGLLCFSNFYKNILEDSLRICI